MNQTIKETDETATVLANATHYLQQIHTSERQKTDREKEAQPAFE